MQKPESTYEQAIRSINDLNLKTGDCVYACAFEHNSTKETFSLRCEPVKGWLTHSNRKHEESELRRSGKYYPPRYFIPERLNARGGDLFWSKAVLIESRVYFKDYESCKKAYNQMVENWALYFEQQSTECRSYII